MLITWPLIGCLEGLNLEGLDDLKGLEDLEDLDLEGLDHLESLPT